MSPPSAVRLWPAPSRWGLRRSSGPPIPTGTDTVEGVGTAPPYSYAFTGLASVTSAVLSQAGMDGWDGGWAILYGPNPVTTGGQNLAIDEDQVGHADRWHTTEQVAFIVFGSGPAAPTAPGAPSNVTATADDNQASTAWSAPADDGGSPVTNFRVTSNPPSANSPMTVGNVPTTSMTGLINGTAYTFTISAINVIGEGPPSPASNSVTPAATSRSGLDHRRGQRREQCRVDHRPLAQFLLFHGCGCHSQLLLAQPSVDRPHS